MLTTTWCDAIDGLGREEAFAVVADLSSDDNAAPIIEDTNGDQYEVTDLYGHPMTTRQARAAMRSWINQAGMQNL